MVENDPQWPTGQRSFLLFLLFFSFFFFNNFLRNLSHNVSTVSGVYILYI